MTEEGGDAACWLHLVCEQCGEIVEARVLHSCRMVEPPSDETDPVPPGPPSGNSALST